MIAAALLKYGALVVVGYLLRAAQEAALRRRDARLLLDRERRDRAHLLTSASTNELLDVLSRRDMEE